MPLAHILTPLLAKKTEQIASQLPGTPNGYLQPLPVVGGAGSYPERVASAVSPMDAGVAYLKAQKLSPADAAARDKAPIKTQADFTKAKAAAKKKGVKQPEEYDPRFQEPLYNYQNAVGALPGYLGQQAKINAAGLHPVPDVAAMQQYEQGTTIAPPVDVKPYKKGQPMKFLPGEPVAMTESGQGVNKKGKKLGYIDQEALQPGIRYLDRRPTDIGLGGGSAYGSTKPSFGQDIDAQNMLGGMYGRYLKDYQDNNNKFFDEMFVDPNGKKLNKKDRDNVKDGVKVLLELQQGTRT